MRVINYQSRGMSKSFVVDDDDYDSLVAMAWHDNGQGYAVTDVKVPGRRTKTVGAHVIVFCRANGCVPHGHQVDHRNRIKSDNTRGNLRAVTRSFQCANRRFGRNKTGYHGVTYVSASGMWQARVQVNRRSVSLGLHRSAELAAAAVDRGYAKFFPGVDPPNAVVRQEGVPSS